MKRRTAWQKLRARVFPGQETIRGEQIRDILRAHGLDEAGVAKCNVAELSAEDKAELIDC